MRKFISGALLCAALLCGIIIPTVAADTALLTIAPDKTELTADGGELSVTYAITVTPPAGREIGVFGFRLKPSGDMTLPERFKVGDQRVITYDSPELEYDQNEGTGVFRTYEYTPESRFFAAVGSMKDKRMTAEARILTITATIPAGSSGEYVLDAEFTVAPDGSGEAYIGKVITTPVTVTDPNAPKHSEGSPTVPAADTSGAERGTPAAPPQESVTVPPQSIAQTAEKEAKETELPSARQESGESAASPPTEGGSAQPEVSAEAEPQAGHGWRIAVSVTALIAAAAIMLRRIRRGGKGKPKQ